MGMSHMPSEAMAHDVVVFAFSEGTSTTAVMVRSVTTISSVEGNTRLTFTSATQASFFRFSLMAPVSTRSKVVPESTPASSCMSEAVRCSTPFTDTLSMVKAEEL